MRKHSNTCKKDMSGKGARGSNQGGKVAMLGAGGATGKGYPNGERGRDDCATANGARQRGCSVHGGGRWRGSPLLAILEGLEVHRHDVRHEIFPECQPAVGVDGDGGPGATASERQGVSATAGGGAEL